MSNLFGDILWYLVADPWTHIMYSKMPEGYRQTVEFKRFNEEQMRCLQQLLVLNKDVSEQVKRHPLIPRGMPRVHVRFNDRADVLGFLKLRDRLFHIEEGKGIRVDYFLRYYNVMKNERLRHSRLTLQNITVMSGSKLCPPMLPCHCLPVEILKFSFPEGTPVFISHNSEPHLIYNHEVVKHHIASLGKVIATSCSMASQWIFCIQQPAVIAKLKTTLGEDCLTPDLHHPLVLHLNLSRYPLFDLSEIQGMI